jgi:cob(I)alamin adenosyltransferase
MKIYTKIGDNGDTYTLGAGKVSKDHIKIVVYGDIDELTSWLGVIASLLNEVKDCNLDEIDGLISFIRLNQNRLFDTGTLVIGGEIPEVSGWVEELEKEIDRMEEKLPKLRKFILPGATKVEGFINVARSVCRRAERSVVALSKQYEIDKEIIKYLNRFSDYLFVLARYVNFLMNVTDIVRDESIYVKNKRKIEKRH